MSSGLDRSKLAVLLGMLGSDFDGEVTNAAKLAERMRHESGMTSQQILGGDADIATEACRPLIAENEYLRALLARLERVSGRAAPQPWAYACDAYGMRAGAAALSAWPEHLSSWEAEFLVTITNWRGRLTPRQCAVLEEIGERVDRDIRASWRSRRAA